jgi:uncharacterized protein YukE
MDHLRLEEVNDRLDRARTEYRRALTVEHQAVQSDKIKLATDEYDQALDAFIKFIVQQHDALAAADTSDTDDA